MKAVRNFKRLLDPSKLDTPMQSILGQEHESHFVQPPMEMEPEEDIAHNMPILDKSQSLNMLDRKLSERGHILRGEDRSRQMDLSDSTSVSSKRNSVQHPASVKLARTDSGSIRSAKLRGDSTDDYQPVASPVCQSPRIPLSRASSTATKRSVEGTRGHARDPLEEEYPYLFIGPSTYTGSSPESSELNQDIISEEPESISPPEFSDMDPETDMSVQVVSESPGAADFDIYETAYRQQIEQIRKRSHTLQEGGPRVYLTRRVESKDDVKKLVGEHEQEEQRSKTLPALGPKLPIFSGPRPTVSGIKTQLEQQQQQNQPEPAAETPCQDHHSQLPLSLPSASIPDPATSSLAATGTTSTDTHPTSENSRARLRSLLGRVKGSRDS